MLTWPRRHPVALTALLVLGTGLVAFVLVYFEPQQLLIDTTVDEPIPAAVGARAAAGSAPMQPSDRDPVTIAAGRLRSGEHHTTGTVRILRLADGRRFVRIERLDTSNGPDVRIWLSAAASVASSGDVARAARVDLGGLKANHGNQNYRIPSTVDLSEYRSVVIWCRRFSVTFGAAPLG